LLTGKKDGKTVLNSRKKAVLMTVILNIASKIFAKSFLLPEMCNFGGFQLRKE
jgi:hypothetical protein